MAGSQTGKQALIRSKTPGGLVLPREFACLTARVGEVCRSHQPSAEPTWARMSGREQGVCGFRYGRKVPGAKTRNTLRYDAIVLSGGEGTRLGGVDKAMLEVGGVPLLDAAIAATTAARNTVVVGPTRPTARAVIWTEEEPTGGGPAAGIIAGLTALAGQRSTNEWCVVIAVDQPGVAHVLPTLLDAAAHTTPEVEGLCPHDSRGHEQWLLAAYRTQPLRAACEDLGTGHNVSVKRLVSDLRVEQISAPLEHLGDINTWADHEAWSTRARS